MKPKLCLPIGLFYLELVIIWRTDEAADTYPVIHDISEILASWDREQCIRGQLTDHENLNSSTIFSYGNLDHQNWS